VKKNTKLTISLLALLCSFLMFGTGGFMLTAIIIVLMVV
jgi:TM2 domain-containing membrane protein YozV